MHQPHAMPRLSGCYAALAYGSALLLVTCASMGAAAEPPFPDRLKPAANESLLMVVPAKGVQIYECRAAKDKGYAWTFVAPEARLFDADGRTIGRHDAGPRWQAADGSSLLGTVTERVAAPAADAIPWLLLATSNDGPPGTFSGVSSIRRVNTVGGVAPTDGCGPDTAGHSIRVPYTADYYFYASQR